MSVYIWDVKDPILSKEHKTEVLLINEIKDNVTNNVIDYEIILENEATMMFFKVVTYSDDEVGEWFLGARTLHTKGRPKNSCG